MLLSLGTSWACGSSETAPGSTDATVDTGTGDTASVDDAPLDDDGGDGPAECFEDDECRAQAESTLGHFVAPQMIDPYVASRCELAEAAELPCGYGLGNGRGEPACLCLTTVDPERFDLLSAEPEGCLAFGRDDACLYTPDEFPGCDVEQPATSCTAICDELQARRQAEAEMTMEGEVRQAQCDDFNCEIVLRLGDRCYYAPTVGSHRSYDCGLTDAEIIQMEKERPDDCAE